MPAASPASPTTPPIQIQAAPQIKSGLPNGAGVVSVPGAAIDPGPGREPVKPGSARAKMMEGLGKIAKQELPASPEPPAPAKPAKPQPAAQPDPEPGDDESAPDPTTEPATEPKPDDAAPPAAVDPKTGKPPKANPWKLFEAEKQARAKAEKELQDVKKSIVPEAERKTLTERVEKAEARAKELEEHIRFVDYEKSEEFQTKYDKPYKDAWTRAMSELKELTVLGADNQARSITSEDMLELVNMSLPQAIQTAKQVFGDAAEYVLSHRKEIRSLFEAQSQALTEARKNGSAHFTKQREAVDKWVKETEGHIKTTWDTVNSSVLADEKSGHYFKPREGDEDWNQRLTKGYQMVDRGFSENPRDPKLNPEQREAIVKRHAAIRNRAAAWGPLKNAYEKLKLDFDEMKKTLDGYKGSEPPAGGQAPPPTNGTQPTSARARMHADLVKLAKPV